jgi:hypothetical protein
MSALLAYRDDGLLAQLLGRRTQPVRPSLLLLVALVPLAAAIAADADSIAVVAAVFAWLILLGGLSRGGPLESDRFNWAVPALLRAGEYAALIWLHPAAAVALLVPLAFRHYDIVYRLRYQRRTPPEWGGGWDGRLVIGWALLALDLLPEGFYVLGGILGVLFVAESVASWRSHDTHDDFEEAEEEFPD